MVDLASDLGQVGSWSDAVRGDGRGDELSAGLQSTVDWPARTSTGGGARSTRRQRAGEVSGRATRGREASRRRSERSLQRPAHVRPVTCRARVDEGWAGYVELMRRCGTGAASSRGRGHRRRGSAGTPWSATTTRSGRRSTTRSSGRPVDGREPDCELLDLPATGCSVPARERFVEFRAELRRIGASGAQRVARQGGRRRGEVSVLLRRRVSESGGWLARRVLRRAVHGDPRPEHRQRRAALDPVRASTSPRRTCSGSSTPTRSPSPASMLGGRAADHFGAAAHRSSPALVAVRARLARRRARARPGAC